MKFLPTKRQNRRKGRRDSALRDSYVRALTRTPLRMVLLAMATGLLLILIHDLLTQNRFWRIRHIQISGCHHLSREQVLQQAQIKTGDNILAVNLNLIRKRLLAHGWIFYTQVTRHFPDKLSIAIKEHRAMAQTHIQQTYLLNPQGIFFKTMDTPDLSGLPEITGLSHADIAVPGQSPSPVLVAAMNILNIQRNDHDRKPEGRIDKISIDPEMGLRAWHRLNSNHQVWVHLDPLNFRQAYDLLPRIFGWLIQHTGLSRIDGIDLRNPQRVVIHSMAAADLSSTPARKEVS